MYDPMKMAEDRQMEREQRKLEEQWEREERRKYLRSKARKRKKDPGILGLEFEDMRVEKAFGVDYPSFPPYDISREEY